MFHLQAGVGLHEDEAVICAAIDEELDGADAAVGGGGRDAGGGLEHCLAHALGEGKGGGDLDQLLALALQAALAIPKVADGAGAVADDLHFHVAGVGQQFLDVEVAGAEGLCGFGAGAGEGFFEVAEHGNRAHPAAAATGDGLEHH